LIERYERTLYYAVLNTLRAYGAWVTTDRVADIQADIMVELVKDDFRRLRKYSGRCRIEPWLKVVASNYTIDQLRKQRPTVSIDQDTESARRLRSSLPDLRPMPDEALRRRELTESLRALCAALPDDDQRFVELFYRQERTFEEIAEAMQTTVGAIYARKNRVRKKLIALAQERGFEVGA